MKIRIERKMLERVVHRCRDQGPTGTVTGVLIEAHGGVKYRVNWGDMTEGYHLAGELAPAMSRKAGFKTERSANGNQG